jgi:hypothetical protein
LAIAESFNAVCESASMQVDKSTPNFGRDPRSVLARSRNAGACTEHVIKRGVGSNLDAACSDSLSQGPSDVHSVQADHKPWVWREPTQRQPTVRPWKDALRVRKQEALGRRITAHGNHALG